jgi:trigger factor
MPQVTRQDIDTTSAIITVSIPKEDYAKDFKKEMVKFQTKATIKGFRPGKVPMPMVEKLYGKSILADIVNKKVEDELVSYLQNSGLAMLGQPLPSMTQDIIKFDIKDLKDFDFKFDIGFRPTFDLQGVNTSDVYDYYSIITPEDAIDKEVMRIRRELGEQGETTEALEEDDILYLSGKELDADGNIKENGFEVERFALAVKDVANDDLKKDILTKRIGDSFRHDVYNLDKNTQADLVHKYILKVDAAQAADIQPNFEYTILEVTRMNPAEMNEAFFEKAFKGSGITDEAGMRAEIAQNYEEYFDKESANFLLWQVETQVARANDIQLPDAHLKRFMLINDNKLKVKDLENDYPRFATSLRNEIISSKLIEKAGVTVTDEEIKQSITNDVLQYFGGQLPPASLGPFLDKMMEDEKQVNETYRKIMQVKLSDAVKNLVTLHEKKVTLEEYQSIMKSFGESLKPAELAALAIESPEEAVLAD